MLKFRQMRTGLLLFWCLLSVMADDHGMGRSNTAYMSGKVPGSKTSSHLLAKRQFSGTGTTVSTATTPEAATKAIRTAARTSGNTPSFTVVTSAGSNNGSERPIGLAVLGVALGITFVLAMAVLLVLLVIWYRRKLRRRNNHIQKVIAATNSEPLLTLRPLPKLPNYQNANKAARTHVYSSDSDFVSSGESLTYISADRVSKAWVKAKALREIKGKELKLDKQREDRANNEDTIVKADYEEENYEKEYLEIIGFNTKEKLAQQDKAENDQYNSPHGNTKEDDTEDTCNDTSILFSPKNPVQPKTGGGGSSDKHEITEL